MGAFSDLQIVADEMCEACGAQLDMPEKCEECEMHLKLKGRDIIVDGKTRKIVVVDGKEV